MNSLKRTLLASSMMVLSTAYGRYARAQQVTVANGGRYLLDASVITAAPTEAAIINDPIASASVSGTDVTISGLGSVVTSGDGASGVLIMGLPNAGGSSVDSNAIINSGAVTTSGEFASGFFVYAASLGSEAQLNDNEITNYGSVSTSGGTAPGIRLRADSDSQSVSDAAHIGRNAIRNAGVIETSADGSRGISIQARAPIRAIVALNEVVNEQSISTLGEGAAAISLEAQTGNVISSGGYAAVTGNTIEISGTLQTFSAASEGILIETWSGYMATTISENQLTISGDILTRGDNASAIAIAARTSFPDLVPGSARVEGNQIASSHRIATYGAASHAIVLASLSSDDEALLGGNEISVSGSVGTAGRDAYGLFLYAASGSGVASIADNVVSNAGAMETSGDNATVIRLLAASSSSGPVAASIDGNQITNSATLEASGADAEGINLLSYSTSSGAGVISSTRITNSGVISTGGTQSEGLVLRALSIYGDANLSSNEIVNAGVIQTAGAALSEGIRLAAETYMGAALISDTGIVNSGSLSTAGVQSGGIYLAARSAARDAVVSGSTISNAATITAGGDLSVGVGVVARATGSASAADVMSNAISNSGTIATGGYGAYGVTLAGYANASAGSGRVLSNSVINGGEVSTAGEYARAIALRSLSAGGGVSSISGNEIRNAGVLATTGRGADGVFLWSHGQAVESVSLAGNRITNSGTISTSGGSANGIRLFANSPLSPVSITGNTITNTGSILTTGSGADAILIGGYGGTAFSFSQNTISNAGSLISAYGSAVDISGGSGNTLSLQAPSFIGGLMALGRGDTVELVSSASHSKLWTFSVPQDCGSGDAQAICAPSLSAASDPTFSASGSVPWFHGTQGAYTSYATFDATGVAGRGQVLGDTARMNSGFVQQGFTALEATALDYRVWLTGSDSRQTYEGSGNSLDQDVAVSGGAIGAALRLREGTMLGGMLALNRAGLTADSRDQTSQDNSTEGFAGGLFLRHQQSGFAIDGGLNIGWGKTSTRRFVNDNLARNGAAPGGTAGTGNATLGNSKAEGDYAAWWFSPEVAAAYDFAIAEGASLTPSARLRYAIEAAPGYSESMSNDRVADTATSGAAKIGDYTTALFEADLALAAAKSFAWGRAGVSGGYIIRQMTGDDDVRVTMLGESLDVPVDASNFYAPYVAADLRWNMTEQFELGVDGRAVFANGEVGLGAMASVSGSF